MKSLLFKSSCHAELDALLERYMSDILVLANGGTLKEGMKETGDTKISRDRRVQSVKEKKGKNEEE